jgi:glycopeptide antibiotics resistance protein
MLATLNTIKMKKIIYVKVLFIASLILSIVSLLFGVYIFICGSDNIAAIFLTIFGIGIGYKEWTMLFKKTFRISNTSK